ncbi:uncharacterized protein HKW66_Vig0228760 [Vigna angularis]|uniref:Uncharacterized protein n=1 Tax=Phaseolus angularis TaxID=3914 RepID=A0A8T0KAK2_PHAAN|nr:uncharacterized protein HKW66_Vig0228760 [Vigna angularis]
MVENVAVKPPQHRPPPPLHLHPHQPLLHRRNLHILLHGRHLPPLPPPLLHLMVASLSTSNGSGTNPPPSSAPFSSTPKAASLPCTKVNTLELTNECEGGRNAAMEVQITHRPQPGEPDTTPVEPNKHAHTLPGTGYGTV